MFLQKFVGLRSSLDATRLETVGAMADDMGGDGRQQGFVPDFEADVRGWPR